VMVARFAPPKRHDVVLDALSLVDTSAKLTFVGDGDLLEVARAQAAHLRERVRFVGQCDDTTAYLDRADALVLLSDYEGLPMSIIEAMRVGVPVIANRLPGLVDAVEDGVTGFLTGLNPQSVATAIERLVADRSLAGSLGSAGRQRWTRSFTAEHMADGYETIYEQACGVE
jgi:glycosyltransferase involved in cell wall biosynthesis